MQNAPPPALVATYERAQNFNALTSFLHSHRYRNLGALLHQRFGEQRFTLLDIGCNTAKCFAAINSKLNVDYLGIDNTEEFISEATSRYGNFPNFRAEVRSATDHPWLENHGPFDVVVALETLEHIATADVFRLIEFIRILRPQLFVCSVPVEIGPIVMIKNFGSKLMGYNRTVEYSMSDTLNAAFYRMHKVRNHLSGHRGFDWRWLAYTIKYFFEGVELINMPFAFLPSALTTNKFMIAVTPQ